MKLIYIMNHYSTESTDHFYHVINLLNAIADRGVEIALVIERSDEPPSVSHPNIRVICQKKTTDIGRATELFRILATLVRQGYKKIFIRISTNAAIVAVLAARVWGAETYYWQSGTTLEVDMDRPFLQKIKWLVTAYSRMWFVIHGTTFFVTGPQAMIDYYATEVHVKREKLLLLYNDIDLARFSVPSAGERYSVRTELGISPAAKMILSVHRLSPVRKTDFYVPFFMESDALANLDALLVVIGDGPEMPAIAEMVSRSVASDRIRLLGSVPNERIHRYYQAADLFVNPSYTEGFPRVVIEAMACGLAVVATDAGGTADLTGPLQREYIVDRRDREAFRQAVEQLLSNPDSKEALSVENLSRVRDYSTESVAGMYVEAIFPNG